MGTSASFALARKITACLVAALLSLALVPASALAEDGRSGAEGAFGSEVPTSPQPPSDPSTEASSSDVTLSGAAEGGEVEGSNSKPLTLASGLAGAPSNFINSDVALDSEPVIGSFTVDGLTYAVIDESTIELVGVSPDWQQVTNSQEGEGTSVAPMLASGSDGDESETATPSVTLSEAAEGGVVEGSNSNQASGAGLANLALPETITYEGADYALASIAPYAFYLSGVTDVILPASVSDVDDRAFRSSDVASVTIAEGNLTYSSFDGALYSADKTRLLLIPEGRVGAVLLPREAEVAEAGKFSHCSLVDAISVEDGAAFASENGLLYSSDLTTLLRVPAGATEITIREGCTTIAAGALEACAKLATINAPATVTSISPDVFHAIPTVSLPAASLTEDAPQLTAMIALSSTDDDLLEVDRSSIAIVLAGYLATSAWDRLGFRKMLSVDALSQYSSQFGLSKARETSFVLHANGHELIERYIYQREGESGYDIISETPIGAFSSVSHSVDWWGANGTGIDATYVSETAGDVYRWLYYGAVTGYKFLGLNKDKNATSAGRYGMGNYYNVTLYAIWRAHTYTISLDVRGGNVTPSSIAAAYDQDVVLPAPNRAGYRFLGWDTQEDGKGTRYQAGTVRNLTADDGATVPLYAQWGYIDYGIGFDTSSEPGDEDYPGADKSDQTIAGEQIESGEKVEIEDPKRPGYVFQGWTIPSAEGTEAIDQDLVYQGDDGKWYVDASKLPDYYEQLKNEEGKIELTARWTSVISVDVPSNVTFYADVVTQGNESREGLASSAFGQSKVASQSEVDLRIVGLESKQVKGNGSTSLGASDILKKKDGSTVSGTDDKLFSLYPATGELKEDDLKDPDAASASKPEGAVDFSLDDTLLEKSFAADDFTIPAGGTLPLGYRLNLQETSTELDYDKLSTLSEGTSASIANISYCFAASGLIPTGSKSDPLWVENTHPTWGVTGVYGLKDIKAAAEDLSSNPSDLEGSPYYSLYKMFLDNGEIFHVKVDGVYLDLQLLGICQDNKTAGGKAGFTFQMKDIYSLDNTKSIAAGQGSFLSKMHSAMDTRGGWQNSLLRNELRTTFFASLAPELQQSIAPVTKFQQLPGGTTKGYLQVSYEETIWLPSLYEICGGYYATRNESESSKDVPGYEPFGYQAYAAGGAVSKQKTYNGSPYLWWTRSSYRSDTTDFNCVMASGQEYSQSIVTYPTIGVVPCFCL